MLVNLIRRAQDLVRAGEAVPASDALLLFLNQAFTIESFKQDARALHAFGTLDDNDIWGAIKLWRNHDDKILALLSQMLLERNLFQIVLSNDPIRKSSVDKIRTALSKQYHTLRGETSYLFSYGTVSNEAYTEGQKINILTKTGDLLDIAQASDLPAIKALTKIVKKNYLCWPKTVSL
jgi:uncharacterized protein